MSYQQEEEEEETVPQQVADLAQASVPQAMRGIRACKRCGILKTVDQFINEGCENCPFLDMVCERKVMHGRSAISLLHGCIILTHACL